MHRRTYLAATSGATTAFLAGCPGLSSETDLGDPHEVRDGNAVGFEYGDGREVLVVASYQVFDERPSLKVIRVHVDPENDSALDSVAVRLRPEPSDPPVDVFLRTPSLKGDERLRYRDADDWTRAKVTGFENPRIARTPLLTFLVWGDGDEEIPPVVAEHEIALSDGGAFGDALVARDRTVVDWGATGG